MIKELPGFSHLIIPGEGVNGAILDSPELNYYGEKLPGSCHEMGSCLADPQPGWLQLALAGFSSWNGSCWKLPGRS